MKFNKKGKFDNIGLIEFYKTNTVYLDSIYKIQEEFVPKKETIEYNLKEHALDLYYNLYLLPILLYGGPILTIEGMVQEFGLFMKYNGLLR